MKRIWNALVALVSVVALAAAGFVGVTAASADDTKYTITINSTASGHAYEAYQIFKGDAYGTTLSNIEWGDGVTKNGQEAITSWLNFIAGGGAGKLKNAADVAEWLTANGSKTFHDNVTYMETFSRTIESYLASPSGTLTENKNGDGDTVNYTISNLPAGYYLVKDKDGTLADRNDAYTSHIFRVVTDVTVEPKSTLPTVDKFVADEAGDAESGATADPDDSGIAWGKTADHAIGEKFQFKLVATLPADANRADYRSYKLVFNDTMSSGVAYDGVESIVATVDNGDGTASDIALGTLNEGTFTPKDGVTIVPGGSEANTLTVTIDNLRAFVETPNDFGDSYVTANIAKAITVTVVYSAHLTEKAVVNSQTGKIENTNAVYLQFSNNPYDSSELGQTEPVAVYVATYKIATKKTIDSVDGNALQGASFVVKTANPYEYLTFEPSYSEADGGQGGWVVTGTILARKSAWYPGYYLANANGQLLPKEGHPFGDDEDFTAMYGQEVGGKMTITSQSDGNFNIVGLDTGEYTLIETVTPDGYNTADDVSFTVGAEHKVTDAGYGEVTKLTLTVDGESADKVTVVNRSGSKLPETGGVGAALFYGAGALAVSVALGGLALALRRRSA